MFLKLATSSRWNHAGIGVWLEEGRVTRDSGQLHVLEINTTPRYDPIRGKSVDGIGFTPIQTTLAIYHTVAVRQLEESYRQQFVDRVLSFYWQHHTLQYNHRMVKFFLGWSSMKYQTDRSADGVFCTEMMALCYSYVFERPIAKVLRIPELTPEQCLPNTYTHQHSPNSVFFHRSEYYVHYYRDNPLQPAILLVVVTVIIIAVAIVLTMVGLRATRHLPGLKKNYAKLKLQ